MAVAARIRLLVMVLVISGLTVWPAGAAMAGVQAATPEDEAVVRSFFEAVNSGDYDAARALVDPNAEFLFDEGTQDEQRFTRDEFLDSLEYDENRFAITNLAPSGPGTFNVSLDITGTGIYPFSAEVTVTVENGVITSFTGTLSEPLAEPGVIPQPGMPTTSAPDAALLPAALALTLGTLMLATGMFMRRRAAR